MDAATMSQEFCLKWNNYSKNLGNMFAQMITEQLFVDVTLACEGTFVKAHKIVLSACSNYFRELLLNNPCKHPIIIMKDIKMDDLRVIVDFMYKGEVRIFQSQLHSIMTTAAILQVKGLIEVDENVDVFESNDQPTMSRDEYSMLASEKRRLGLKNASLHDITGSLNNSSVNVMKNVKKRRRRRVIKKTVPNENGTIDFMSASESAGSGSECDEMGLIVPRHRLKDLNQVNSNSSSNIASDVQANRESNNGPASSTGGASATGSGAGVVSTSSGGSASIREALLYRKRNAISGRINFSPSNISQLDNELDDNLAHEEDFEHIDDVSFGEIHQLLPIVSPGYRKVLFRK